MVAMNTMTTPKGGQYRVTLGDGTKVWLNAASSITYPTAFTGKKREVSITGEAYFEVSKNKEKPFIVKTSSDEITVLGTSFNINAYADEQSIKTSLLLGTVKIGNSFLKPGEGYQDGKIVQTNVQQDIAWKNGKFNFKNLSLEQVMRQIARWYDVEPVYSNGIPEVKLGGGMDRSLTLVQVLEGLKSLNVNCRLEGRKLIITM